MTNEKTEKQKIIERVQKLMAMAEDATSPNEAAIAAGRARKLIDTHQLSVNDLLKSDGFNKKSAAASRKYNARWEQHIQVSVARLNDTIAYFEYDDRYYASLAFKGLDSDVSISVFMHTYLVRVGKSLCKKHMKAAGYGRYIASVGDSFKRGYSQEISKRLAAMQKEREQNLIGATGTSLVSCKLALVTEKYGMAKYRTVAGSPIKDMDLYQQGKDAAANVNISAGINSTASAGQLS